MTNQEGGNNAQIEKEIIAMAEALCNKFIKKCEIGQARSVETLRDCRELRSKINDYKLKEVMPGKHNDSNF